MSRADDPEVAPPKSPASTSATLSPYLAASNATLLPTIPPPITSTSNTPAPSSSNARTLEPLTTTSPSRQPPSRSSRSRLPPSRRKHKKGVPDKQEGTRGPTSSGVHVRVANARRTL